MPGHLTRCFTVCVCVCVRVWVFPSVSLSQCVGTWAAKLLHGLIDFMPSSHIYSHLLSDSPPSSQSSFIYLVHCPWQWFTLVTSSWAGSRTVPCGKRTSRECCVSLSCDRAGFNLPQWVRLGGRWWGACSLQALKSGGRMLNTLSIGMLH